MAADIQIIVETVGEESIERAVKTVYKLENRVDGLARSWAKGKITGNQFKTGLSQIAKQIDTTSVSGQRLRAQVEKYGQAYIKATSNGNIFTRMLRSLTGQTITATKSLQMAGLAVNQFGIQASRGQVKMKRFGSVGLQQVGYQVGDFAVQIQGGTSALVALGQQGSQLLGILGPMGAIAGAALAIWTSVARIKQETSSTGIVMEKMWADVKKAIEPIKPLLGGLSSALSAVGDVFINFANLVINNLERVTAYVGALIFAVGTKLAVAFLVSGRAAAAMIKVIRLGLIGLGFGAVMVALGEVFLAVQKLRDAGLTLKEIWTKVQEVLAKGWDVVKIAIKVVAARSSAWINQMRADSKLWLSGSLQNVEWFVNKYIGAMVGLVKAVKSIMLSIPSIFLGVFTDAIVGVEMLINKFLNGVVYAVEYAKFQISRMKLGDQGEFKAPEDKVFLDLGLNEGGSAIATAITEAMSEAKSAFDTAFDESYVSLQGFMDKLEVSGAEFAAIAQANRGEADSLAKTLGLTTTEFLDLAKAIIFAKDAGADIDMRDWFGTMTDLDDEDSNGPADKVKKELTEIQETVKSITDNMQSAFEGFFNSIVDGTISMKDAFKDMARSILKQLWDVLVVQQIVGSFNAQQGTGSGIMGFVGPLISGAMGAPTASAPTSSPTPPVRPFASGGIVGSPTLFPMADGMGLMGEAGPEAIMPLKRGKDGKLGVAGGGGDTIVVNQSFNFSANGDESVKKLIAQAAPSIANLTKNEILKDRRRGGAMKATFG